MALKDTNKLVHNSLNITSKLIESDTDVSVIDLNLLENLNTNQSLNYIKLEQSLNELEKNADKFQKLNREFRTYQQQVDEIEAQVEKIKLFTKELDSWSKELDAKLKKR